MWCKLIPIQSAVSYKFSSQVDEVVDIYRRRGIPILHVYTDRLILHIEQPRSSGSNINEKWVIFSSIILHRLNAYLSGS